MIVCLGTASACWGYDELVTINFIIKQVNSGPKTCYSVAGLLQLAKEIGLANSAIRIFAPHTQAWCFTHTWYNWSCIHSIMNELCMVWVCPIISPIYLHIQSEPLAMMHGLQVVHLKAVLSCSCTGIGSSHYMHGSVWDDLSIESLWYWEKSQKI